MILGLNEGEQAAIEQEQAAMRAAASESGRRHNCQQCGASEYEFYNHTSGEDCEDCGGELAHCPWCNYYCKQCDKYTSKSGESEGEDCEDCGGKLAEFYDIKSGEIITCCDNCQEYK